MSKKPEEILCLTVAELARRLGCPFEGDGNVTIRGVASLESAEAGDLVFFALPKFRPQFERTKASAAVVSMEEKNRVSLLEGDEVSPEDYLSLIGQFDYFIGIPMHSNIFSTSMNVPTINLYYEPKGKDYFEDMLRLREYLFDINRLIDGDIEGLLSLFKGLVDNDEEVKAKLKDRMPQIRRSAYENVKVFKKTFLKDGD